MTCLSWKLTDPSRATRAVKPGAGGSIAAVRRECASIEFQHMTVRTLDVHLGKLDGMAGSSDQRRSPRTTMPGAGWSAGCGWAACSTTTIGGQPDADEFSDTTRPALRPPVLINSAL